MQNMKFNALLAIIPIFFNSIQAYGSIFIPPNCTEIYSISVPRYVPYEEIYRTKNWLGITKYKTRTNYRLENHISFQKREVCCAGYSVNGDLCMPLCINKPCDRHGNCVSPDVCRCDDGYQLDHTNNQCIPVCSNECSNGYCSAPNVCTCNEGFRMTPDGYTCEPICSCNNLEYCVEPSICRCIYGYQRHPIDRVDDADYVSCEPVCERGCINADCVEPNFCKCHEGYVDLDNDVYTCEPVCTAGCYFGECTAPETCTCFPGHKLQANSSHLCEPICENECVDGKCAAPNFCDCFDGYFSDPDAPHICRPFCSSPCTNGECTQPFVCSCNAGYASTNNHTECEPVCAEPCLSGTCTAPDTCTCFEGYTLSAESKFACEPVCANPCINGRCTAPNECTCDDGFEKKNSTDDDSKCIVICECENGRCDEMNSTCSSCLYGYDLTISDNSTLCQPRCEGGCEHGRCVEPQKCECDELYLADNDTLGNPVCVHACGGDCAHGSCLMESNACSCLYGWGGEFCDEPTACGIAVPEDRSISLQLNELVGYDEFDNAMGFEEHWTGPSCYRRCLDEINNATKCTNQTIDNGQSIQFICFVNISSPCNVFSIAAADVYQREGHLTIIVIAVVASLLVIATTILVTLYIRKKRQDKALELPTANQDERKPEEDCLIENENDGISL